MTLPISSEASVAQLYAVLNKFSLGGPTWVPFYQANEPKANGR